MAVQEPSARQPIWLRASWKFWVLAALLGIGIGSAIGLLRTSSPAEPTATGAAAGGPVLTWPPGKRQAPAFQLHDAAGAQVSLAQYRGRNVVVTFIDPLCTTFCPLESAVVNGMLRKLPPSQRPEVIAVNVNAPIQADATLKKEARRFRWLPQWRWGNGTKAQLASVWSNYGIAVIPSKGDITHTEAAFFVDGHGDLRALFLWPFSSRDLLRAYRKLG